MKDKLPGYGKRKREGEDSDEDGEKKKGGKETAARNETERRMYEAVRKQGRQFKTGGVLGAAGGGGGDYQVADTKALEKLVSRK